MNKHYFHLLIILGLAWGLYAKCQEDSFLPLVCFSLAVLSYLMRIKTHETSFAFMGRVSVVRTFIFSAIGGIIWRIFMPAPTMATAIYLEIISAAQSASIIAALLFWLKPYSLRNIYWLTAVSWATVALSINVPFDADKLLLLRIFCILSAVNVLIHTFKEPPLKKRIALHCRQLLVYGLILMVVTGVLFRFIALGIRVFDQVSMSLIGDYLFPRGYTHFLNLSPLLRLGHPGESAFDRRPILEVDSKGYRSIYLKTQVFEKYHDGIWEEAKYIEKIPLSDKIVPDLLQVNMLLYNPLKDIIPSPYGLKSARGKEKLVQDTNHIVYGSNERRTRILNFSMGGGMEPARIDPKTFDQNKYLKMPAELTEPMRQYAAPIMAGLYDPMDVAYAFQDYFQKNFLYTLNVDFRADEAGLLKMLSEKSPAYCTYFATAMTMMLRSAGIPSRVVTGFASGEKIARGERILVRVKNAHAWSEALLPFKDKKTGEVFLAWQPFDATPSNASDIITGSGSRINVIADRIWLFTLRAITHLQNIDKDKAKVYSLVALILILVLMNLNKIIVRLSHIRFFRRRKAVKSTRGPQEILAIYHRYENYLKEAFGERRKKAETDSQVIKRLASREDVPKESLHKIHSFIESYRSVRFGHKKSIPEEVTQLFK